MEIKLIVPDNKIALVIDAFCDTQGYQATITDPDGNQIPNPETPAQFTKRCIAIYIKQQVHMHEDRVQEQNKTYTDVVIQ